MKRESKEGRKRKVGHWLCPFLPEPVTNQQGRGIELSGPGRPRCLRARRESIMARKQSARRTLCFRVRTAREAQANRLLFGRGHGSASRRCLTPAGRADGLWLAPAPFTSRAGSADMTGMASGWQWRHPPPACPSRAGPGRAGRSLCRHRWVPVPLLVAGL